MIKKQEYIRKFYWQIYCHSLLYMYCYQLLLYSDPLSSVKSLPFPEVYYYTSAQSKCNSNVLIESC